MEDKTFIVSHSKAKFPITITGKTLKSALIREGLDPNFWKEIVKEKESEVEETGDNQGDARPEDN